LTESDFDRIVVNFRRPDATGKHFIGLLLRKDRTTTVAYPKAVALERLDRELELIPMDLGASSYYYVDDPQQAFEGLDIVPIM
jgi:hypothetical protein